MRTQSLSNLVLRLRRSLELPALAVVLAAALPATRVLAQAEANSGEPAKSDAKEETPPLFYLRDGSKVAGSPGFASLRIRTKYGVLTVPEAEIVRVRLVPRVEDSLVQESEALVEKLGSDDFDTRELAYEALLAMGRPALAALRAAVDSGPEEARNRAVLLVGEIESVVREDEQHAGEMNASTGVRDEVVTKRMTILGSVELESIAVATRYGSLDLSVNDIVGIDFRQGNTLSGSVAVSGSSTIPSSWVASKLEVRKGQKLDLRASGELNVSNYNLTCGPGGTTRYSSRTYKSFPQLSLVGKIGKSGKEFLVGERYKGRASADGELYLGVVPFQNNYAATGEFKVKVSSAE